MVRYFAQHSESIISTMRLSQADISRNAIDLEAGHPSSMTKRASTCRSSSLAYAPTADDTC